MYTIRFMFDWNADSCIWSNEPENTDIIGLGLLNLDYFDISDKLKLKMKSLCQEFQSALNWDEPQSKLLWNETQINSFKSRAQIVYDEFIACVGNEFIVENWIDKSL